MSSIGLRYASSNCPELGDKLNGDQLNGGTIKWGDQLNGDQLKVETCTRYKKDARGAVIFTNDGLFTSLLFLTPFHKSFYLNLVFHFLFLKTALNLK